MSAGDDEIGLKDHRVVLAPVDLFYAVVGAGVIVGAVAYFAGAWK